MTKASIIRSFTKSDTEPVMKIWLNSNIDAHPFVPEDYWRSYYQMVGEQLSQAEVYVLESEGVIRGFIGLDGSYIAGIFVEQKHRSAGIGRQLLEHARKLHPVLSLHVYQKNQRAVDFYLREGFSVTAEGLDDETGNTELTMTWKSAEK